ncbi:uncharacterized protein LOC128219831 [Mya arenaria]|uniref:uncharacterized protein LOC128219831 n=1 Tax=Mya arenaria TaxID=6604 RepID=UPI0022E24B6C|nr:uncharacterized protein LOC128219831 [Mya arenaria]XP_052783864.1 uncharacterized protein LOC128219831 [Mya arenaria]XP_052783865.1 uncharacterized protein LOC128219831 [Mya arenaria]
MAKPQIIAAGIVALLIILMTIILLATSLKKLSSDQIGLTYDTINKNLGDEVKREGLHNGPPGFEFIIFPSVYKTISFSDLKCLNKDGVIITLDVTYQFKAQPTKLHDLIINFKDYDGYKKVLEYTGESALHESCSYFNTSQFQAERGKFQERVKEKIIEKYTKLYADITDLQVSNIERPSEYEDAIRSKERAREDIEVARNERPRLVTEAMTEFLEANTTSQIIRDKAESDKRILQARAEQEAKAIIEQYQKESEAYAQILDPNGLGFTVDGFIAYMGVRVISSAQNPVYIGLQSPAKSSYMTP